MTLETRICKKCGKELPITNFRLRNKSKKYRYHTCIDCDNSHHRFRYNSGIAPRYYVYSKVFCLIYVIKNHINEKVYVGQTWGDLPTRWHNHLLKNTNCIKLQRAIKKYGKENFDIELLTICHTQGMANYWEIFFIRKFDSIKKGYNILEFAFSRKGIKHSTKSKKKMSAIHSGEGNSNSVLILQQVNQIRAEYNNFSNPKTGSKYGAISMLAKKYNVAITTIFEIVKGMSWK